MMWVDYTIDQVGTSFKVKGDTETEVMDKGLYTEGDVFVVKNGWLQIGRASCRKECRSRWSPYH